MTAAGLVEALRRLDALLVGAVDAAAEAFGPDAAADPYRGLVIGPDEVARLLCREPGEPVTPDSPWVVLAEVTLDDDGTITKIDNCACRRIVASAWDSWHTCESTDADHPKPQDGAQEDAQPAQPADGGEPEPSAADAGAGGGGGDGGGTAAVPMVAGLSGGSRRAAGADRGGRTCRHVNPRCRRSGPRRYGGPSPDLHTV